MSRLPESTGPAIAPGETARTRVRPASFEDYQRIARLESRYGLEPKGYDEWTNLWIGNPAYHERRSRWPIGWVIEDAGGEIVGSLGNIPLRYEFQGREIVAATGRALVAEPAFRSGCLLLLDRLINQPGVDLYLNNTIGPESAASFSVFECPRVPAGVWDESGFWITQYCGFFESFFKMRGRSLARPLSYPVAAAAFVRDRIAPKVLPKVNVAVAACGEFDDRFDTFWERLKRNHPGLLLAVRSRETLEWHYKPARLKRRLWVATISEGPDLSAYAIFYRNQSAHGLKRVRLIDFQSLDQTTNLMPPILAWVLERCSREGIHMFECVGRWLDPGGFLDWAAPYRRKLSTWIYFYRANDPALAASLENPAAWAPSLYDGDATL